MNFKKLCKEEVSVLEDNGESEDCIAIESNTIELSTNGVGTFCGTTGNQCFSNIAGSLSNRVVRGWYDEDSNTMIGMIHIQCNGDEAEAIEKIAQEAGGSLRPNDVSEWDNFYEFESE